jgi:CRP-like cAMP-binding protein
MSSFQQFKNWLKQVSFLTEDDCSLFENQLTLRTYKKNETFISAGGICRQMGFVNHGAFRMFYLADGKEINTHFCFENEFVVDYDSFLQEKPSRYYIAALEDSSVVTFTLPTLLDAYNRSQNWERFGRIMAEYSFKTTTQRVESFLFMNGEERYLNLQKNQPAILDRVPLYHIASYLGLERESLSRLRKKIARQNRL